MRGAWQGSLYLELLALVSVLYLSTSFFNAGVVRLMNRESASTSQIKLATEEESSKNFDDDLLKTPQFMKKKIEILKKQIVKIEEEIEEANAEADKEWEEWGPQIERLRQEFSMVKSRMLNDTMDAANTAKVQVITSILEVTDNFERANQAIRAETEGEKAIVDYYSSVFNDIQEIFTSLGMEPVPTVGHPFDYNMHDAVMRQPSAEYEEDIVCMEFTKGYKVGNALIRPALVAVSTG